MGLKKVKKCWRNTWMVPKEISICSAEGLEICHTTSVEGTSFASKFQTTHCVPPPPPPLPYLGQIRSKNWKMFGKEILKRLRLLFYIPKSQIRFIKMISPIHLRVIQHYVLQQRWMFFRNRCQIVCLGTWTIEKIG